MAGICLLISLVGIVMFMFNKTLKVTLWSLSVFAVSLLALQSIGHNEPMLLWAKNLYGEWIFTYTIVMLALLMAKCLWLIARNLFLNPKNVENE